ncbi:LacI family DNA-binding transcriptional regulator [Ahrensia kielensis]|uniref:LacI family DNA-binding transcriptional regulator n=1 Tax=Ahrensia kielensis TaxID=76980 RepID=UPI00036986A5|nr:LacI family DNA-binding transcriptional regulator [Ahrensia kielensis]
MATKPKLPTMLDVAKLAGVSPMTVSRALRPDTSVGKKTRENIQNAAEELGYVLNTNAANFASHKTGFVAVTIPSINNANFAETLTGLSEGLRNSGLQILLGYTDYSKDEEERLVEQFLQRRPEAVVVTGGSHTERCRRLLKQAGVPVIEMWDEPEDPIDEHIGFSNAAAASLMVDHFVSLGRTKIGFIGGDEMRDTRGLDRRRGFVRRLDELDIDSQRIVSEGPPPVTMREGVTSLTKLLEKWPDTDAVMCVSDLSAFGAISHCIRNNIQVPEQIAIAGFGAYDISEVSNPTITTIDVDAKNIGKYTAALVANRLGYSEPSDLILGKPKLLVRESTTPI